MHDAMGQPICPYDLVVFQKTTTTGREHHGRGVVVEALPAGKDLVSVLRVDGTEVAKKACDLTVVDRSCLYTGMAVTSVSDPSGQLGILTGVTTELDLAELDLEGGEPTVVATGVSPADVRPVKELALGDYVVSGTWLGRVVELSVDVEVLFADGSSCRVTRAGDKLRVLRKGYWHRRHKNAFYPGDGVAGATASVFKQAGIWLKGYWKPTHGEGTVAKVEMGGAVVYWVASLETTRGSAPPAAYQPNPGNLRVFSPGGPGRSIWCWGASTRCFFRSPPNHSPAGGLEKKHRRRIKRLQRADRRLLGFERPMAVADTRTAVDVLWQDGTRQCGVPSASVLRIQVRNEQDLFPGQRIMSKTMMLSPVAADNSAAGRVGIVKSLSFKDQTVCVSWSTAAPGDSSGEVDTMMSTYDLCRSPEHYFFYGDIVVRRISKEMLQAQRSNKANNNLSWVGYIVDCRDSKYVQVNWGDGTTSKVLHHEIALVKQRSVAEMRQEMRDRLRDDKDIAQKDMPQEPPVSTDNVGDSESGRDADPVGAILPIGQIGTIIQAVIRTVSGMIADGKMYMWSVMMALTLRPEPPMTENIQICSPRICGDGDCHATEDVALAGHNAGGGDSFHFQRFDVVQCPQDHHYLDGKEQGSGGERKWLQRVQKEWIILEDSLPDTIYVRAYEDRMDLLRTVIVGASGTPYHDGLFFFDLKLPSSYPATPPEVKYHSFGLRANPNLYPSGTVCLSLLNTFGGEGPELWSTETSSILQVFVSIQGLVLTARPYYNEAGYTAQIGTPEGCHNELPYCENTYLVNLQTMLHLIRRPPEGFEVFVMDHFRRRGQYILHTCKSYLHEGYPVGTLDGDANGIEVGRERQCSMGFRLALANVVPRLVEAFTGIGAQGCNEFDQLRVPPLCTPVVSLD